MKLQVQSDVRRFQNEHTALLYTTALFRCSHGRGRQEGGNGASDCSLFRCRCQRICGSRRRSAESSRWRWSVAERWAVPRLQTRRSKDVVRPTVLQARPVTSLFAHRRPGCCSSPPPPRRGRRSRPGAPAPPAPAAVSRSNSCSSNRGNSSSNSRSGGRTARTQPDRDTGVRRPPASGSEPQLGPSPTAPTLCSDWPGPGHPPWPTRWTA